MSQTRSFLTALLRNRTASILFWSACFHKHLQLSTTGSSFVSHFSKSSHRGYFSFFFCVFSSFPVKFERAKFFFAKIASMKDWGHWQMFRSTFPSFLTTISTFFSLRPAVPFMCTFNVFVWAAAFRFNLFQIFPFFLISAQEI